MSWSGEARETTRMQERPFLLDVEGHSVPGVYWSPAAGADRLVLLGHGGTTHKKIDYIVGLAQQLTKRGLAAMAIDGPGHGERATEPWGQDRDQFPRVWTESGGTETVLQDWRAALDFIEAEEGARPTGWWGLSMGTMMGLPVTATEPRIQVATLGLMGTWGPNKDDLVRLAGDVTCPLRFLVQLDDEIVPYADAIELFGLLGSKRKTMHVNPGLHADVPVFEIAGSVEYLDKQLSKLS